MGDEARRARSAGLASRITLRAQTDERLVELARSGHSGAFEAIAQRYRGPLLRQARRLLHDHALAEDAVQQALLNAYRALRFGEARPQLGPWLHRICHNSSLGILRARAQGAEPLPEDYGSAEGPDEVLERRERLSEVVTAIEALPARQRHAILLRELEGRTHEEIAAELDTAEGAVRQLIHRARAALREAATAVTPFDVVARLATRSGHGSPTGRTAELFAGVGAGGAAKGLAVLVTAGAAAGGMAISQPPAEGSRLAEDLPQTQPPSEAQHGSAELSERVRLGRRGARGASVGRSPADPTEGARDRRRGRTGSSADQSSRSPRSGSGSSGSGSSGSGSSGSDSSGSGSSGSGSSGSGSSGSGSPEEGSSAGSSGSLSG